MIHHLVEQVPNKEHVRRNQRSFSKLNGRHNIPIYRVGAKEVCEKRGDVSYLFDTETVDH